MKSLDGVKKEWERRRTEHDDERERERERGTRKLNEQEVGAKMKSFLDLLKCNGREGRK